MNKAEETTDIASISLSAEMEHLTATFVISERLMARMPNMQYRVLHERSLRQLVANMEVAMLKRRIHAEPKEIVEVPATWWDALKERWLPKRFFPVKYREIPTRYELWAVCPHIPTGEDRDREVHVAFLKHEGAGGMK